MHLRAERSGVSLIGSLWWGWTSILWSEFKKTLKLFLTYDTLANALSKLFYTHSTSASTCVRMSKTLHSWDKLVTNFEVGLIDCILHPSFMDSCLYTVKFFININWVTHQQEAIRSTCALLFQDLHIYSDREC